MATVALKSDNMSKQFQLYPNLFNDALPFVVGCAKPENTENSKLAFQRCLPSLFKIDSINWEKASVKPICRWNVKYTLADNTNLPMEGHGLERYFRLCERYTPYNTRITDSCLVSDSIVISYGVFCLCTPDLDPEALEKALRRMYIEDENNLCS